MSMNLYAEILENNLLKILNLYDMDPMSDTFGFGDREYWGWKIKDFSNGTMQGGVHALSIALKLGIFEDADYGLSVVDAAIKAISRIRDRNGSLVEAYPAESSFCVTALVAFDVLSAIQCLGEELPETTVSLYLDEVRPLISFISRYSEEHAVISNHLATAVAALALWNRFTSEGLERYNDLLQIIYDQQADEGWYREYEGADPGYQTLCTYYLFCAYQTTKDNALLESLLKSLNYLQYFVHPDGTIGGLHGARNTEVYYPAGIIGLAKYSSLACSIAERLEQAIRKGNHLLPSHIDIGNFVPLINAYAVSALYYGRERDPGEVLLPCDRVGEWRFPESGIFVRSTSRYYAIVNYFKGGTLKVFDKDTGELDLEHGGLFGELQDGTKFSTQVYDNLIDFADYKLMTGFYKLNSSMPTALTSILLRLLSLTIFRSVSLGNLFKKRIVKMLMTGKTRIDGQAVRQFEFNEKGIKLTDSLIKPKNCRRLGHAERSRSIHMASSGYHLKPHLKQQKSNIVESRLLED